MRKDHDIMKKDAWEKFQNSGSVNDYLSYKNKQSNYLNEMGTEVIVRSNKGDRNGRNSRRDRSKN